jgi:hypothetical protein
LTSPSEDAHSLGRSLEERRDSRILRARQARQRTRETRQAKHKRGRPTAEKVDYEAQARAAALAEAEAEAAADAYAMAAAPSTRVSTTVRQDSGGTVAASAAARATVVESQEASLWALVELRRRQLPLQDARRTGLLSCRASAAPQSSRTTLYAAGSRATLAAGRNSPSRRTSPEAVRQSEARRYRNIATGRHSPDGKLRRSVRPEHGSGSGGRMSADGRCSGGGAAAGPSALAMSAISVGPERETTRVSRRAPDGLPPRNTASRWLANEEDRHSLDGFI